MSADGLKPLSRLGLSKVQPTASKSATDGSKISMGENHTQRVVAVPKRHARVPQAPTDCWPGNHDISAALGLSIYSISLLIMSASANLKRELEARIGEPRPVSCFATRYSHSWC